MPSSEQSHYQTRGALHVHDDLLQFVEQELLPELNINASEYWSGIERICAELMPENLRLLQRRDYLQNQLDKWHQERKAHGWQADDYLSYLIELDYLVQEGEDFSITTKNVDAEIARIAGPQLVVPSEQR